MTFMIPSSNPWWRGMVLTASWLKAEMNFSTRATVSTGALAPSADFNLKPFHPAGLWLAVITIPQQARRFFTA